MPARDLDAAYRFLRTVEHRLQMVADEQTHTLPSDREGIERFARFAGFKIATPSRRSWSNTCARCSANICACSRTRRRRSRPACAVVSQRTPTTARRSTALAPWASASRWRCQPRCGAGWPAAYPSLRGEFARTQFTELVPVLLDRLARAENPDTARSMPSISSSVGLQRGGRLFSLLKQNPDLVTLVALTLGTAPRLADILARHPEAMDALLEPTFFGALPDEEKLAAELARTIKEARTYEDFLDRLRMFSQEHMFLVGARILSDTVTAEQAGDAFARLADV